MKIASDKATVKQENACKNVQISSNVYLSKEQRILLYHIDFMFYYLDSIKAFYYMSF